MKFDIVYSIGTLWSIIYTLSINVVLNNLIIQNGQVTYIILTNSPNTYSTINFKVSDCEIRYLHMAMTIALYIMLATLYNRLNIDSHYVVMLKNNY